MPGTPILAVEVSHYSGFSPCNHSMLTAAAFWTAVSYATTLVDGEGTQRDYWSYIDLIKQGVIKSEVSGTAYC